VIIILFFSNFGYYKNKKTHTFSHFDKKVSQLAKSNQKNEKRLRAGHEPHQK
jgi:hypothetical protein